MNFSKIIRIGYFCQWQSSLDFYLDYSRFSFKIQWPKQQKLEKVILNNFN